LSFRLRAAALALRNTWTEISRSAKSRLARTASTGLYSRPLDLARDRVVLLFFEDVERDTFVRGDRHLRRNARRFARALRKGQTVSGVEMAVRLLIEALERLQYRVVLNDRALAARNPHYPIGLAGYPHVLDGWDLPNPAILGPGLLDHPLEQPRLMEDPRFRAYIVPSDWMQALFEETYPGRTFRWFAGIDVAAWPDFSSAEKDLDFLIYEKFLWDKEGRRRDLLAPIEEHLRARGLRFASIRYGSYVHAQYRELLQRSRGILFLCDHETQGIACAEAMACNVPVLAWDQGRWLDPLRLRFGTHDIAASSVPYFAPSCGEKFVDAAAFPRALERFLERLGQYEPRRFVAENLSLELSGSRYLERYAALASESAAAQTG
jgi:glycosyltransferase involved in cell wall biosynthesis